MKDWPGSQYFINSAFREKTRQKSGIHASECCFSRICGALTGIKKYLCDMGYNKRNKLERICEIQRITLEHTRRGVTQKWVYDNVIYPRFYISLSTFYEYLATPARRELARLLDAETQQLSIF